MNQTSLSYWWRVTLTLKPTRIIYDQQQRPVQQLCVNMAPERSRILMDMSIDAVDTLATGSIVHDKTTGNY